MHTLKLASLSIIATLCLIGCEPETQQPDTDLGSDSAPDLPVSSSGLSAYVGVAPTQLVDGGAPRAATSCDDVRDWIARRDIERWLRGEFAYASSSRLPWSEIGLGFGVDMDMSGGPGEPPPGEQPTDRSQPSFVDGRVAEPTPMLMIGAHLYAFHHDNVLSAYEAWPAASLTLTHEQRVSDPSIFPAGLQRSLLQRGDELLALNASWGRWSSDSYVQRYALANPGAPAKAGEALALRGGLRAARLRGERLLVLGEHTYNNNQLWSSAFNEAVRAIAPPADINAINLVEAQRRARTLLLANLPALRAHVSLSGYMPNALFQAGSCQQVILSPRLPEQLTVTYIHDLDAATLGDAQTSVFMGRINRHYTSPDALYITEEATQSFKDAPLHVMRLKGAAGAPLTLQGSAQLEGQPYSDFGMDEHEGNLRVVTSLGQGQGAKLAIIGDDGGQWREVGVIKPIAPDEQLTATRAFGAQLYVMTAKGSGFTTPPVEPRSPDFIQPADPLFIIDAADPSAPTILGELDFPGFASHVQPISADRVLAVGRAEDGTLRLQLFDISDRSAPTILHQIPFSPPGWDTWSQALIDRLSFTYHADRKLIALPAGQDLALFSLDLDAGFTALGLAPLSAQATFCPPGSPASCGQHAQPGLSPYSLFAERFVYTLSPQGVAAWDSAASPMAPLVALPFGDPSALPW